ncbi:TetR/AcrR family transcriptional regulator [Mycobacterium branderi]|uniref:TetR family transcriptional regulator n=2 Tax=Mycobacterium branderi TaxID=43348 RepID=A0ABM7KID9_9MYCO|nr:TetR/AcrR family transcriptional regulator [Mycobacterium branderi]MCV7233595.1 TetR/AcrR family transcriptional regulator [Mycobacterium branderi]BBZ10714.1 TetR family transcriptional regulator [Mycobacterium branderi]
MVVQSRRAAYTAQTRDMLLRAAGELFVSRGFDCASVDDIAAQASVTKGAFYHHFPDKRSVFERLFRARIARLAAIIEESTEQITAGAAPGWAVSQRLMENYLTTIVDDRDYRELLKQAPAVLTSRLYRRIDEELLIPPLQRLLSALRDRGELHDVPLAMTASMLISCLCEAALLIADAPDRELAKRDALVALTRLASGLVSLTPPQLNG